MRSHGVHIKRGSFRSPATSPKRLFAVRTSTDLLVMLILGLFITPISSVGASELRSSTSHSVVRLHVARVSSARFQPPESAGATTLAKAPVALRKAIESTLKANEMRGLGIDARYSLSGADIQSSRFKFHVGRSLLARGAYLSSIGSSLSIHSNEATFGSNGVLESFHSNGVGVEQTFHLGRRPSGTGPLLIDIPITGMTASLDRSIVELHDEFGKVLAIYSGLLVRDALGKKIPASLSVTDSGTKIVISLKDAHARYPLSVDPTWTPATSIPGVQGGGTPLAIDGSTAVFGNTSATVGSNTNQGDAYVYNLVGTTWEKVATLTSSDGSAGDLFGYSVALRGGNIIVGAPSHTVGANANQGAAYVFTLNKGFWSQSAEFTATNGSASDFFGSDVAYDGTTAVIGAPGTIITNLSAATAQIPGNAYVFSDSNGTWAQAELAAPDGVSGDTFGWSVAVSGSTVVVGAPWHAVNGIAQQGAAYIFDLSNGDWIFAQELSQPVTPVANSGSNNVEHFGYAIAVTPTMMMVGAPGDNFGGGFGTEPFTSVYFWSGSMWSLSQVLSVGSPYGECATCTAFGASVSLSGGLLLVGAPSIPAITYDGTAFAFQFSGGLWYETTDFFGSSSSVPGWGGMGWSVAVSGGNAFVGADSNYDTVYGFASTIPMAVLNTLGRAAGLGSKTLKPCTSTKNPVNCASGDFWHSFTDASISGFGPGIELTRTYNSLNASTKGIFGYGWSSSYDQHLTFNADGSVTVTMADGSQMTAVPSGAGVFTVPGSADSTLTMSGTNYVLNWQGRLTYHYNSSGQLLSISDPNGYSTTLTYSSGALSSVIDSSGRQLTLAYGTNGLVSSVTDPLGRVTHYAYDSSGDLTSVTDPLGHVTSFSYDFNHLLLTMTFPNGQSGGPDAGSRVTNTYNSSGQVLTQTDQMGNVTAFAYSGDNFSPAGGTTTITDPNGNVEVESYFNGTLQSLTKGYGTSSASTWYYQYDPATLGTTAVTDPNGNTTTASYDASGNVISRTNALGQTSTYSYNSLNEPTCQATPLAASPCSSLAPPTAVTAGTATITPPASAPPAYVTYREYDTDGNLIYTTAGDYSPSGSLNQQRTSYDLHNGQSVTLGSTTDSCATSAPSTELPCATINPDGVVTQLTYDSHGDLTSKSTQVTTYTSSPGVISTFAGGPLGPVTATTQSQSASQVATATIGGVSYLYVADPENNVIHRINLATDVETVVAGTYAWGYYGDGFPATQAQLSAPSGVAVDAAGDIAIADTNNNVVRFVPAVSGTYFGQSMTGGDMYTIAGNGTAGLSGNAGPATSAELDSPQAVAFDGRSLVIADTYNDEVRFVPATSGSYFGQSMTADDIYAIAGKGIAGFSGDAGVATSAELQDPEGVAVDASGDVLIGDSANNVVRFVAATTGTNFGQSMTANDIYSVAGNGTAGYAGDGGAATSAELRWPTGVNVDASGDLLIADNNNHSVRLVAATTGTIFGQSMTANDIFSVAGHDALGNSGNGAPATSAAMDGVNGVAMDTEGNLYVADVTNDTVRVVAASTGSLAGQSVTALDIYNFAGSGPHTEAQFTGPATEGQLSNPTIIRTDAAGNIYIADAGNNAIRFIPKFSGTYFGKSMTANSIYTIAGNGVAGYSGNGGAATSAELNNPSGVAVDAVGDVAIADTDNHVIRFIPAASGTYFGQSMTASDIYTIAGNATSGYAGNGGAATSAELNFPGGVSFDASGDLVIADSGNNIVRFVPVSSGTYYGQSMMANDVYTIAGNATAGYSGNGGVATSAELSSPQSVSVDLLGDVLIADSSNNVVRFVAATSGAHYGQSMTSGDIYTIAGNGTTGYTGNGGVATSATLSYVLDASFDSSGNVLITDSGNDVVRYVPAVSGTYYGQSMTGGDIYTIAGAGWSNYHFGGDGSAPLSAQFGWLTSAAPDEAGGYYIVDNVDQRVRHVSVNDTSTTNVTTTYGYDTNGELTSLTTPNGNITGANAVNFTTTYAYNADGQMTSETQGGGAGATVTPRTTVYTYDGDGNNTSVTDARGYTTTTAFNSDDEATLVTNPLGNATLTCYDGVGNVTQVVPAVGVAANSLTATSCPTSFPSSYGNRLATDATATTYNALGLKTVVTSPAPPGLTGYETTTYAYDPGGRLTTVTAPSTSTTTGAASDVTNYTYDAAGQLLTTTVGAGTASAATTSYCYDPNGNKTASVAADGNVSALTTCATSSPYQTTSSYQTGYEYDSLGELVTEDAPATSAAPSGQITTYTYDPAGNQLTSTNANSVTATRTYTPLNQLASVTYSDGTHSLQYSYDANGNVTGMVDASGTTASAYDPFNELTSTTDGAGKTTSYFYDVDGNTTGITYPLGSGATWASSDTVAYAYDHADQLASVTDFNGHTSSITTSADGLPTAQTLGSSGDTVSTSYAADDAPTSITLSSPSSTLQQFAYSDAPSGAIASETDFPSSPTSPAAYTYNAQSQVTQETPGTATAKSYSLDASGNLTTLPTGASGTYNADSELTSSTLSGTTTSYTYDAAGNRSGESVGGTATVSATYNGANQLTSYSDPLATMTSATYNGLGLRTAVTVTPSGGGSRTNSFVWNTLTAVPRLLRDASYAYIYGQGATPLEQVNLSSGALTYLVTDALGSVRGVVSSSGALMATTSYDAWGNAQTTGGLFASTNFGFAGGYLGSQGLYYFINRYYDPAAGQFLSVDPAVSITSQPYSYTGGNPVNEADPLGLCVTTWFGCIGPGPANGISGTLGAAWNDTGGKVVSYVSEHRRGIEQIVTIGGAIVGSAACDAFTDGLCVVFTPEIGGATGLAVYAESGGTHNAEGYTEAFGAGALVGALSLAWAGVVPAGAALWAGDSTIGAVQGVVSYGGSAVCQSASGYLKAAINGALQNAPIKLKWLLGRGAS